MKPGCCTPAILICETSRTLTPQAPVRATHPPPDASLLLQQQQQQTQAQQHFMAGRAGKRAALQQAQRVRYSRRSLPQDCEVLVAQHRRESQLQALLPQRTALQRISQSVPNLQQLSQSCRFQQQQQQEQQLQRRLRQEQEQEDLVQEQEQQQQQQEQLVCIGSMEQAGIEFAGAQWFI